MTRKLRDKVVVVTGASSGIGRATARAFAKKGANVVVAARRLEPLAEVADECRSFGREALAVPTDVSHEGEVQNLARTAAETFGHLDVWVNNAGVTLWARVEDAPMEEFRRVIETNLFGYVHGARAALRYFRRQGHGVLINNASMVSRVSEPYAGAYVISKHGIRALGMTLRQELALDPGGGGERIDVCTVMPATIDTPLFQHSANYTGRVPKALPPVYPAERVAKTIVRCATRPRREVFVGTSGRLLAQQAKVAPGLVERRLGRLTDRQHLYQDRPAAATAGNLFEPSPDWTSVDGGWHGRRRTRMRRAAAAGAVAAGGWWWLRPGSGERAA